MGVVVRLPDYIKRKHRFWALVWGGALLAAVLLLALLRTPVPQTVINYRELEQAYKSRDKAVVLAGETTRRLSLGNDTTIRDVYGYGNTAGNDRGDTLTVGSFGDRKFLIQTQPLYRAGTRQKDEPVVYRVKSAGDALQNIRRIITGWEEKSAGGGLYADSYGEKIEVLTDLAPLMLQEYRESEARPYAKLLLWLLFFTALAFLGIHALPLLLPAYSKTGACFRAYGLGEDDAFQLDADKNAGTGPFARRGSFLSPRYVSIAHYTDVFVRPIHSLLWVYPAQVIEGRRHGAGVRWYLECWFQDGKRRRLPVKDKAAAAALSADVKKRFPGVLAGFSPSVFSRYDGKEEKLQDFRGLVEQRQQGLSPAAQADVIRSLWGLSEDYQ